MYDVMQKKGLEVNICIARVQQAAEFIENCKLQTFETIYDDVLNETGPQTN